MIFKNQGAAKGQYGLTHIVLSKKNIKSKSGLNCILLLKIYLEKLSNKLIYFPTYLETLDQDITQY